MISLTHTLWRACVPPLLALSAYAAAELPRGQVLARVECSADASQSYALYVPSNYNPAQRAPVLFCFDPGARGRTPVERFAAAAEKFGFIVAGSNNSRNGPWPDNVVAINAMIRDVDGFFPLDQKRVYVAGLSGGARVACQIAMNGLAQGVVSCSAAFADGVTPAKVPCAFFGTAGVSDFNYRELRRVNRELEQRRAVHRVVIHEGGHEWLSPELAVKALAWFQVQAMRSGAVPKDPAWLQAEFAARLDGVPAGPPTTRFSELKSVADDFKGLVDTARIDAEVAQLGKSREVRDGLKAEVASDRKEEQLIVDLLTAAHEGFSSEVKKTAAQLRTKAAGEGPERAMAGRVLQGAYANCAETVRDSLRAGEYLSSEPLLEMMILLRPERSQAYFDLARCRAHRGDRKRALASLEQAVAVGFSDGARLREDPAFAALRQDPAFVKLAAAAAANPPEPRRR